MRQLLIIAAIIIANSSYSQQQNSGLYGKKTVLEVNMPLSYPFLNNLLQDRSYYKRTGPGTLTEGKDLLDYGIRISLLRSLANNFSLGFEYGLERQNIAPPPNVTLPFSDGFEHWTILKHENMAISTTVFMPKMEFASRQSLLPIGLSHQIGVGPTVTKVIDREYLYQITVEPSDWWPDPDATVDKSSMSTKYVDYLRRYKGISVMYEIHMKMPVTKFLTINYGIRYNFNWVFDENLHQGPFHYNPLLHIRERRIGSAMTFNIGAGFVF